MSSVGYPGLILIATIAFIVVVAAYFVISISSRKR